MRYPPPPLLGNYQNSSRKRPWKSLYRVIPPLLLLIWKLLKLNQQKILKIFLDFSQAEQKVPQKTWILYFFLQDIFPKLWWKFTISDFKWLHKGSHPSQTQFMFGFCLNSHNPPPLRIFGHKQDLFETHFQTIYFNISDHIDLASFILFRQGMIMITDSMGFFEPSLSKVCFKHTQNVFQAIPESPN